MDRSLAFFVALFALTACDKAPVGVGETPASEAKLRIVAGDSASDTIQAVIRQALVVQVDVAGAPKSGVVVRFEAVPSDDSPDTLLLGKHPFGAWVAPLAGTRFGELAVDTTRANGRAATLVQLGPAAGRRSVRVTVPEFGITTLATVRVAPGAAVGIDASPADTALFVGSAYRLRASTIDRFRNRRGDTVAVRMGGSGISLASDLTLTGNAVGRAFVAVSANGRLDTAWVSVVPKGTLAAYSNSPLPGLVRVDLDGSHLVSLAYAYSSYGVTSTWAPGGDRVLFTVGSYSTAVVYSVPDTGGTPSRFLVNAPDTLVEASWPHFSRDGSAVFFSGRARNGGLAIWRAAANGTGAARVGRDVGCCNNDWRPSPSKDGTRLAFVTGYSGFIQVMDVATGAVSAWQVAGVVPRWSPTAEQIAYQSINGSVWLMNADGTNRRQLSAQGRYYQEGGIDWSPDGEWLVVRGPQTLELINVQSGLALPLPFARNIYHPSWKP